MAYFTSSQSETCRPSFNVIQYDDMIQIDEHRVDSDGKTLSAHLENYVFLGMLLVLGYRTFNPEERSEDRNTLEQHLHQMPKFIDPGPGRAMARRNCEYLRKIFRVA